MKGIAALLLTAAVLGLRAGATTLLPPIVPLPQTLTTPVPPAQVPVSPTFAFTAIGGSSQGLRDAFARFTPLIAPSTAAHPNPASFTASKSARHASNHHHEIHDTRPQRGPNEDAAAEAGTGAAGSALQGCDVNVGSVDTPLTIGVDESYSLTVSGAPSCTISAPTLYGALHAMETLVQLTTREGTGSRSRGVGAAGGQRVTEAADAVFVAAAVVHDKPRFPFRATMIDTSRHYYSVEAILEHLDAMSAVKMNVLHWHLVDAVSFPYVSTAFPELSAHGAFHPSLVYTPDDIARVVTAATARGIVVVPEIDTPGHVWAGFAAIDELLTACYDADGTVAGTGPLDPSKESTFSFLSTLLKEILPLFKSGMFMVGGDEVDYGCWASNPTVRDFCAKQGWGNGTAAMQQLESYYAHRLLKMLDGMGSEVMCWEELFDNGLNLTASTVVNVWKGKWEYCTKAMSGSEVIRNNKTCAPVQSAPGGSGYSGRMMVRDNSWAEVMGKAAAAGHRTVLSAPFYLNHQNYGSNFVEDWPFLYAIEPTAWNASTPDGRRLTQSDREASVAGVEACMWSEWVDGSNAAPRFWPRAAAVAERGWSSQSTVSIDDFRRRIHAVGCEFKRRGLPSEPVVDGGQFFHENGTVCTRRGVAVLGPPEPGCLPRFSWCPADA
eukprot:m.229213 g.229213  ORF g.229213 m.229213 type:complete len:664 (+) comp15677_c0_seq1:33-2024(+)